MITLLAEASPLAGRLAFAGVFLVLIVWLVMIPKSRLAEGRGADGEPKPLFKQARTWALVIALVQFAVYLFWR